MSQAVTQLRDLEGRLSGVAHRRLAVTTMRALGLAAVGFVSLLAVSMLVDWLVDLPWAWRLAILALNVAGLLVLLAMGPGRLMASPPSSDALAILVEAHNPRLAGRLVASIQLGRESLADPVAVHFHQMTVGQAHGLAAELDFPACVKSSHAAKACAAGGGAVLVFLLLCAWLGQPAIDLLSRAFLGSTPVPRKTRVECLTGDLRVARGDAVTIEANAHGVIPGEGTLELVAEGQRTRRLAMPASPTTRRYFSKRIESLQSDFGYQVRLGDGVSEWRRVTVVEPPTLVGMECEQEFPAYTRLRPAPRDVSDPVVLLGSQLRFRFRFSQPLGSARLELVEGAAGTTQPRLQSLAVALDPMLPSRGSVSLQVMSPSIRGFRLLLADAHGLTSRDRTLWRLDVRPDESPRVRIVWPERKEELVTPLARMVVGIDATDDYGIASLVIHYRVLSAASGGAAGPERSIVLDLGGQVARSVKRRFDWAFSSIQDPIKEGDVIEYWVEAQDSNSLTGPGRGFSDRLAARIVSDADKRSDLMRRLSDQMSLLTEVAQDQEKLTEKLGQIILERRPEQR